MTKFAMCKRCRTTKPPLERNWVTPGTEYCSACELEMNQIFLQHLGYSPTDVHQFFAMEKKPNAI